MGLPPPQSQSLYVTGSYNSSCPSLDSSYCLSSRSLHASSISSFLDLDFVIDEEQQHKFDEFSSAVFGSLPSRKSVTIIQSTDEITVRPEMPSREWILRLCSSGPMGQKARQMMYDWCAFNGATLSDLYRISGTTEDQILAFPRERQDPETGEWRWGVIDDRE
jgi:hypothetical protein